MTIKENNFKYKFEKVIIFFPSLGAILVQNSNSWVIENESDHDVLSHQMLDKRESCVCSGPFANNIVFKTQVCITQDISTNWKKKFLFMHSGVRCYFIPKMPSPWPNSASTSGT